MKMIVLETMNDFNSTKRKMTKFKVEEKKYNFCKVRTLYHRTVTSKVFIQIIDWEIAQIEPRKRATVDQTEEFVAKPKATQGGKLKIYLVVDEV